jgi:predicted TIM-barrel fold metal-dependent hydrolase
MCYGRCRDRKGSKSKVLSTLFSTIFFFVFSVGVGFLSEFEDRLFFGTDLMSENMPVRLDSLLISWKEQGKISETTFNKIAYKNAEKLLGL